MSTTTAAAATAAAAAAPDILALTSEAYWLMPADEQDALKFKTGLSSDLSDLEALKARICDFVHVRCLSGHAATLGNMNRRYTRQAKKLGMTPSAVVQELSDVKRLRVFGYGTINVLATPQFLAEREAVWDASGMATPAEREAIQLRFLQNAE